MGWLPPLLRFFTLRLVGLATWLVILLVSAFVVQNYENWSLSVGMDNIIVEGQPPGLRQAWARVMDGYVIPVLSFLTGPFGIGFLMGAVLFSLPDLPAVRRRMAERRAKAALPKRDAAADKVLTELCRQTAQEIFEGHTAIQRMLWDNAVVFDAKGVPSSNWNDSQELQSRETERLQKRVWPKVAKAIAGCQARGMTLDLWGMHRVSHGSDLGQLGFFLADIAEALDAGDYMDRTFRVEMFTPQRPPPSPS